jgi:two-component system sensor histidine kinase RegB
VCSHHGSGYGAKALLGASDRLPHKAAMEDVTRDSKNGLDPSLFALAPEDLGSVQSALGRTRLRSFITLRWLAVAGQTIGVLFVAYILNFQVPLALCLAIIASSAWMNVFLTFAFQSQRLTQGWEAVVQLSFDTVQLAALLAVTGGLDNPFLLLLVAPVTVAALSLRRWRAVVVAIIALSLAALMPLAPWPLPWIQGEMLDVPPLFEAGHFIALAVGVAFFAVSAARISLDEAHLVRALDAAGVVMAREQRLSALGAMSAMTAHELGTPLATIHLVSKELANELADDHPFAEDVHLIAEQAERCRGILNSIRESRDATDIVHAQMPISTLVEEAAAPHFGLGVDLNVVTEPPPEAGGKHMTVARSPEILHALGAFIENAVSFADTAVSVTAAWSDTQIIITVSDDGPGFADEVIPKLGEPYVSERGGDQLGGGDMGLGFFIAKTLIERTGGRIATRNRTLPRTGAVVQAVWPRDALEVTGLE